MVQGAFIWTIWPIHDSEDGRRMCATVGPGGCRTATSSHADTLVGPRDLIALTGVALGIVILPIHRGQTCGRPRIARVCNTCSVSPPRGAA